MHAKIDILDFITQLPSFRQYMSMPLFSNATHNMEDNRKILKII